MPKYDADKTTQFAEIKEINDYLIDMDELIEREGGPSRNSGNLNAFARKKVVSGDDVVGSMTPTPRSVDAVYCSRQNRAEFVEFKLRCQKDSEAQSVKDDVDGKIASSINLFGGNDKTMVVLSKETLMRRIANLYKANTRVIVCSLTHFSDYFALGTDAR